jgi:RimJ/RimL family protein N-acetyltransferase
MKYKRLNHQNYSIGNLTITSIREVDIMLIRMWRNDQMNILRQTKEISIDEQREYFDKHIWPTFYMDTPSQILFSYLDKGECIGYGGFVHISWIDLRAEISFLLNTSLVKDVPLYQYYFQKFLEIIKFIAFEDIKLNRISTETYDIRPYHIAVYSKANLKFEGRLKEHVLINGKYEDTLIHSCLLRDYALLKKPSINFES